MTNGEAEITKHASFILAKKEVRLLFKSKRRIFILSITPFMILVIGMIMVFGINSANNNQNVTHIYVINDSPSTHTDTLLTYYSTINNSKLVDYSGSFQQTVESGEYQVMVYIPSNFSSLVDNNTLAKVYIAYNSNSSRYETVALSLTQLTNLYQQQLVITDNPDVQFNRITPVLSTTPQENKGISESLASTIFIIPVYIMFFVVIPPISLIMISVTIEREQETLETLFLQPVPRDSIILGKILYGVSLVIFVLILDIIMVGIDVLLYNLFVGDSTGEFQDLIKMVTELLGVNIFIYFLGAIVFLSVLVVSLSVLLSLLAKDEREANLTSSIVPLVMVSMIIIVQAIELSKLPYVVQIILTFLPIIGILIALYLELVSGSIGLIGICGIVSQIIWIAFTIRFAARLSESESILELNFQRVAAEIKKMIFRK